MVSGYLFELRIPKIKNGNAKRSLTTSKPCNVTLTGTVLQWKQSPVPGGEKKDSKNDVEELKCFLFRGFILKQSK